MGIDWKLAREKRERAAATAEHAGATAEETETPGSGTGAVSELAPTRGVENRQHQGGGVTGGPVDLAGKNGAGAED